jgi:hypothetical protein
MRAGCVPAGVPVAPRNLSPLLRTVLLSRPMLAPRIPHNSLYSNGAELAASAPTLRGPAAISSRHTHLLAISLVVATVVATWLLSGVTVGEAARFISFEALYVVLPGCLLYLLLISDHGGWLRVLAIGWPLGYAVEVGAFALSAAAHEREAFTFLPTISIVLVAALWIRERGRDRRREPGAGHALHADVTRKWSFATSEPVLVAIAISAVLVMLAITSFTLAPLPGHFRSVVYPEEYLFATSVAADARHHWPITTPWIAGLPLRYYTAVFIHGAAINQVTDVALPTIYMRLLPTTANLLLALQLWTLGRSMMRSRWAGLLAIILFFFVGAATLTPRHPWPFEGYALLSFWSSTTFTFGAPFFLGLLSLMQHWLGDRMWVAPQARVKQATRLARSDTGVLVVLAVLVLGCAAAKMFAAVDFVGGLGLFWLWSVVTGKARRLLTHMLAIAMACVAVAYFGMLAGGLANALRLRLFNTEFLEHWFRLAADFAQVIGAHSILQGVLSGGATVLIAICLSAPVLGAVWLLSRCRPLSAFEVFCSAIVLVGIIGYYLAFDPVVAAELYFREFGYFALVLLAAGGLADFVAKTPKDAWGGVAGACGVVFILGLVVATGLLEAPFVRHAELAWDTVMYTLAAAVVVLSACRLHKYFAPVVSSRFGAILACCIPVIGVLGLMRPVVNAALGAKAVIFDQAMALKNSVTTYGINVPLYRGMVWVRTHTRVCDVLAVNNHSEGPATGNFEAFTAYSAFTERRIFLESWGNTIGGIGGGEPFPRKRALNDNAVVQGDPIALRRLAQEGVSYVLIDKIHGRGAPEPSSVSHLVFSNSALDVYHLLTAATASHSRVGCGSA